MACRTHGRAALRAALNPLDRHFEAAGIEQWLELVSASFNVIPMDARAFRAWARLMHRTSDTLYENAMIAATAKAHKLTVVTRNVTDFKRFVVTALNPFAAVRK